MTISLEVRSRLFQQCVLRSLRYAGPGAITLDGAPEAVRSVVEALSVAQRPDLALALVAGAPREAGASAFLAVVKRHGALLSSGLLQTERAEAAVRELPRPMRGGDPLASARALREARALDELGFPVDEDLDSWSEEVTAAALEGRDVELCVAAVLAGVRRARLQLAELLRGPGELQVDGVLTLAGARRPGNDTVDPAFTWEVCSALADVDAVLSKAVADAFCAATLRAIALGKFAPEAFTADGMPHGRCHDGGTAAALCLLANKLPDTTSLDGTPPVRGAELDEEMFLDQPRRVDPQTVLGAGVTAGELLAEHFRRVDVPDVELTSGVVYGEADGHPLRMHLARPRRRESPAPLVVFVHGGGWSSGNPAKFLRQMTDWSEAGWVTASIGYRLVPETVWPGPLDDVFAALSFFSAHADALGVDRNRVALVGNSAGGHLALMAASAAALEETGVRVSGVVTISPLTDTLWPTIIPDGARLVRRLVDGDATKLADASPVRFVRPGLPPVLTITGDADDLTTAAMVTDYHRQLDLVGVPNELHVLPGRFHAFEFNPADSRFWSERAFAWLSDLFAFSGVPG